MKWKHEKKKIIIIYSANFTNFTRDFQGVPCGFT